MTRGRRDGVGDLDELATEMALAEGTGVNDDVTVAPGVSFFQVTIQYREPEFEARRGGQVRPFCWTYRIAARDEHGATAAGIHEFRATAKLSSVSWRREIIGVTAVAEDPDPR